MILSIVIVSYNTKALLDPCLAALARARARIGPSQVIVVDNASRDGSADHLAWHHPDVRLIRSDVNVGFGRANNLALPYADAPFVLLLNADAFVADDSLEKALAYMQENSRCGIVGVRLVGRDGAIQPSCRYLPTPANIFLERTGFRRWFPKVKMIDGPDLAPPNVQACEWVPGCFYLIRREVIAEVGLFDPRYFLYYEEVDHCLAALRAGWQVIYLPTTTVVHIGGESARSDSELTHGGKQADRISMESALLYFRKNLGMCSVLRHVGLELFGDFYLAAKAVARGGATGQFLKRMAVTIQLASRTRLGRLATR